MAWTRADKEAEETELQALDMDALIRKRNERKSEYVKVEKALTRLLQREADAGADKKDIEKAKLKLDESIERLKHVHGHIQNRKFSDLEEVDGNEYYSKFEAEEDTEFNKRTDLEDRANLRIIAAKKKEKEDHDLKVLQLEKDLRIEEDERKIKAEEKRKKEKEEQEEKDDFEKMLEKEAVM